MLGEPGRTTHSAWRRASPPPGEVKPKIDPEEQGGDGVGSGAVGHPMEAVGDTEVCLEAWKDRGVLEHHAEQRRGSRVLWGRAWHAVPRNLEVSWR